MKKLAINGGKKIRIKPFPSSNTIDKNEEKAVIKVLRSGVLSKYLGAWHKDFYGGQQVRRLEEKWQEYFHVKNAISVNSATSGLISAVGACGIGPKDEVIVSPYSMCISSTAPLFYGAVPVFADVEKKHFCLDPDDIERKITKKTKAIIVVDLFGQPYNVNQINKIAKKYNLKVIEDAAQAPSSLYKNKFAGTLGDIGIFSLNYHKHIHTGEGGVVVTNNNELAEKVRLIRNHAEAVVEKKGFGNLVNMIGFNFRMTEIEAAIAGVQLQKLKKLVDLRIKNVQYLVQKLNSIPFLESCLTRKNCKHVFYMQAIIFHGGKDFVHRDVFINAVKAELNLVGSRDVPGNTISTGYAKPLYSLPLFQKRICFGKNGYPFNNDTRYDKNLCPVAENLYKDKLFLNSLIHSNMKKADLDDIVRAFYKVYDNINELK